MCFALARIYFFGWRRADCAAKPVGENCGAKQCIRKQTLFNPRPRHCDTPGNSIPAPIPEGAIQEIRRLAALVFDAVSCEGLARVDFFYTTSGEILVNEINTIPGLSPASYFQKMWEASGLAFPQLIDRLLRTALHKRPGLR